MIFGDSMTSLRPIALTYVSLSALFFSATLRADDPPRPPITILQTAPATKNSAVDVYTTYVQDVNAAQAQFDVAVNLVNSAPTVRASYMGVGVDIPGDTLR